MSFYWKFSGNLTVGEITCAGTGSFASVLFGTASGNFVTAGTGSFPGLLFGTGSGTQMIAGTGSFASLLFGTGSGTVMIAGTGSFASLLFGTGSGTQMIAGTGSFANLLFGTASGTQCIAGTGSFTNLLFGTASGTQCIAGTGSFATLISIGTASLNSLILPNIDEGDLFYVDRTLTVQRLPIGTVGQVLKVNYDSYTKMLLHCDGVNLGTAFTDEIGKVVINASAAFDSYTKLMVHFDGTDGATAYTAETGQTVTFVGTAQLDTAQKEFGTASLLLDGDSDYVTVPDSDDWYFGTGDFTLEGRIQFNNTSGSQTICGQYENSNNHWELFRSGSGRINLWMYTGGVLKAYYYHTNPWAASTGTWYHVAFVRIGTTGRLFVNGTLQTITENIAFGTSDVGNVAATLNWGYTTSTGYFNGWLDETRVSKGIARYGSSFTPPISPYGQVTTMTATKKFGTASAEFKGGGDSLSLADSADWNLGSGDFTIDFWIYPKNVSGDMSLVSQGTDADNRISLKWQQTDTTLHFIARSGASDVGRFYCTQVLSINTWYHIAFVRSGSTAYFFVNGVSKTVTVVASFGTLPDLTATLNIGVNYAASAEHFYGLIDELRFSKGVARWTAEFTPPTTPYNPIPVWSTP